MSWIEKEPGPDCFCGCPTMVVLHDGGVDLLCFFHTNEAGAMFPLPEERPENWPNLSEDEMAELMEKAYQAREEKEKLAADITPQE